MIEAWMFYPLAAITALFVKIVDEIEDTLEGRSASRYIFATIYGLLIGFTISFSPFPTLWLGILVAQFVTGKIDKPSHFTGFFVALAFTAVFGINGGPFVLAPDFLLILVFASLDELNMFDWAYKDLRLGLKIAMFIYGFFARWDYFIALICFDLAYMLTGKLFPRHIKGLLRRLSLIRELE